VATIAAIISLETPEGSFPGAVGLAAARDASMRTVVVVMDASLEAFRG
jgi:hypothetical protein